MKQVLSCKKNLLYLRIQYTYLQVLSFEKAFSSNIIFLLVSLFYRDFLRFASQNYIINSGITDKHDTEVRLLLVLIASG